MRQVKESTNAAFSDYLRYLLPLGDGVYYLSPEDSHGYLAGFRFRGFGKLGQSWEELAHHMNAMASVFGTLDNRWCIHLEVLWRSGGVYPSSGVWPDPVTLALDQTRKFRYESEGEHWLSEHRLWFSYFPRTARIPWLARLLGDFDASDGNAESEFRETIGSLARSLKPHFAELNRLSERPLLSPHGLPIVEDEMATGLVKSVCGYGGMIAGDTSEPMFVAPMIAPSDVEVRPDFRIGDRYVGVVTVIGYPQIFQPAMVEALRPTFKGELKYVTRIIPYNKRQAASAYMRLRRQHLLSSLTISGLFGRGAQAEGETTPSMWRAQCKVASDLAQQGVPHGSSMNGCVIYGKTPEDRDKGMEDVRVALEGFGLTAKAETQANRFPAYLGFLPGEADVNESRVARFQIAASTRMAPVVSTFHGAEKHPHKKFSKDPLLMLSARGREPFRAYLHVRDVGHTLVIARTGKGKSLLQLEFAVGHLSRYEEGRVIYLDIGYSAYKYAKASGGRHITIELGVGPQLAVLSGLKNPRLFPRIEEWLLTTAALWLKREIRDDERQDIKLALKALIPVPDARVSDLQRVAQIPAMQNLFGEFRGSLFDAPSDDISFVPRAGQTPFWAIELGGLGSDASSSERWMTPTVLYLQRRIFEACEEDRFMPTLVIQDEGARALKLPSIQGLAERLETEGRKYGIQYVFSAPGVGQVLNSSIRDILIEQTVTKIAFPNRDLLGSETLRAKYEEAGYSRDAISEIATMGEWEIWIQNELGAQVVTLNPMPFELAILGNASPDDRALVDQMIDAYGTGWVPHYLRALPKTEFPDMEEYARAFEIHRSSVGGAA